MHDQRVFGWAPLRDENPVHGIGIARVRTKAIDRFSREGDEFAGAQTLRRERD